MSKVHAKLSPSGAYAWTSCTAKPNAEEGYTNESSDASRQGTLCHQVQEEVLRGEYESPYDKVGQTLVFWKHPESGDSAGESWATELSGPDYDEIVVEAEVEFTEDMADKVAVAVAFIREQHLFSGGELHVEQRVPVGHITGEEDAGGTSDVTIVGDTWVHGMDSKFGRMQVNASEVVQRETIDIITGEILPEKRRANLQIALYTLGAIKKFDLLDKVKTVTMTIVQPFIGHTDSYTCSIEELLEVGKFLSEKAEETRTNPVFNPTEENCHFCLHRFDCKARTDKALNTAFELDNTTNFGFVHKADELTLGSLYALVPFVKQWADDIEEATRKALDNGVPVVRGDGVAYRFTPGKAGKRTWLDEGRVADALEAVGVPEDKLYHRTLISPAEAQDLTKQKRVPKGQPKVPPVLPKVAWEGLQNLITQAESRPQIVLDTDSRPSLNKADGFENVPTQAEELAVLFGDM